MTTEVSSAVERVAPPRRDVPRTDDYVVVHLVSDHDAFMDLVESQVVDHMVHQAQVDGADRPSRVMVALLQPLRVALSRRMWKRVRQLRQRSGDVSILVLPYVEGVFQRPVARAVATWLRRITHQRRVVFHCRGERSVLLGRELAVRCRGGVVADIRGAWSEEVLQERGFDGPELADATSLRLFHGALSRLHDALADVGPVISVSDGMLRWLEQRGVHEDRLLLVPCCVSRVAFSEEIRARRRAELGLEEKLVFAYAGTIASYQHIEDGLLPFFRSAVSVSPTAHLLCLTNDVNKMTALIGAAGIPDSRVTVLKVLQRDVADCLCAADAGILMRAPTRLTRLSLPVKFAEYLASGLPVIVSRIGEWLEERVSRQGIGTAIECFGVSEERLRAEAYRVCELVERHGATMRRAALEMCEQEFLWARYVPFVRNAYRTALGRNS